MMKLSTRRLRLCSFVKEDWAALFAYQTKPEYLRFYSRPERSKKEVIAFLEKLMVWQQEKPRTKFQLAVVLAENQQLIGTCGLRKSKAESQQAELGYEIDPAYWGQGYATEAGRAMLEFGFETLRLHRIWAACISENVASARVLEKLDFTFEGQLRENRFFKDRWWDTRVYSMLKHEWR